MEKPKASRNLRIAAINAMLSGFSFSMMRAVGQPFVLSLGAPMSTLGLLESLGGIRGILTGPIQYFGGWLSDRIGRRPFMALGNLAALSAVCLYVLAALSRDWRWLLPAVILAGAALISDPAQQSLIAESTPIDRRGMAFSIMMAAWIAPGIFAPSIGGYLADRWGFIPVFLLQFVLYGSGLFLIVRYLRETLRPTDGGLAWGELKGALVKMVVPPVGLRGLYLALAVDSFTWGLGYALLFGMLSESYGFTTFQLGIMSSMLSVSWALSQLPIGKLIDRYGSKPLMVISELMSVPIIVGWLFSTTFTAFAFMHACFGIIAATWVPAQNAILANSVSEYQRGEAMGRMAAFRGLIGFPAPLLGGMLYDHFGFQAPLLANLTGVILSTILLVIAVKEPRSES
jgi:DHA1 family multidrug resistance protein-like MFS transporter